MEQTKYIPKTLLATTDGIKVYYSKDGKNVMVNALGNWSKDETISSSSTLKLGTLPAGCRPKDVLFYPVGSLYSNAYNLTLALYADGGIALCSTAGEISLGRGKYFNFAVEFII